MNLSANLVGLLVPIALGVSGGLLTLVGLIAVFVSIDVYIMVLFY